MKRIYYASTRERVVYTTIRAIGYLMVGVALGALLVMMAGCGTINGIGCDLQNASKAGSVYLNDASSNMD